MSKLFYTFVLLLAFKASFACNECTEFYNKSLAYKNAKNYLEAWRNLDKAIKLHPDNLAFKKEMADIQFNRRAYYDANILNEEILKAEPQNVEAIVRGANLSILSNRFDKAIEYANSALTKVSASDKLKLHEVLGNAFYGKKYYPQAIESLKKVAAEKNSMDINSKIAKSYEGLSNYAEAAKFYEKNIELDPARYYAYMDVANAAYMANQYEKAIHFYTQAKEKGCPVDNAFYSNVAVCFFDKGDFKNAVLMYAQAKEFAPYDSDIRYMIAQCHMNNGDFKQARNSIEEYLALYPEDADMVYMLGMTYLRQENRNKAEQYFNQAFAMKPELTKLRQQRIKF